MKSITKEILIQKIKEKKELRGVADDVVNRALEDYVKKYKIDLTKISKSDSKVIIKATRSELRLLTGRYQRSVKRNELAFDNESINKMLMTHSSTAERMDFYPKLREIINKLKIHSILDLGCGLNPIALAEKKYEYFASDIKEDELKIIEAYFNNKKIKGKAFSYDLRTDAKKLPSADLCIMLKVLDIIAKTKKDRAVLVESLLRSIQCNYFLISFSTKKLSGKRMNYPKREWFERILAKLNLEAQKTEIENELFYLIKN